MMHILNSKNSQPLDKNLNLAMPTFGPTIREYYTVIPAKEVGILRSKKTVYDAVYDGI